MELKIDQSDTNEHHYDHSLECFKQEYLKNKSDEIKQQKIIKKKNTRNIGNACYIIPLGKYTPTNT